MPPLPLPRHWIIEQIDIGPQKIAGHDITLLIKFRMAQAAVLYLVFGRIFVCKEVCCVKFGNAD